MMFVLQLASAEVIYIIRNIGEQEMYECTNYMSILRKIRMKYTKILYIKIHSKIYMNKRNKPIHETHEYTKYMNRLYEIREYKKYTKYVNIRNIPRYEYTKHTKKRICIVGRLRSLCQVVQFVRRQCSVDDVLTRVVLHTRT